MKYLYQLAAIVAAFMLSVSALAEEDKTGFYVAPEVGLFTLQDYCDGVPEEDSCEDSEIGFGFSGGYWFNDHIAAEGGIRLASGFDHVESQENGGESFGVDVQSIALGGRVRFPIGEHFAATGKAGVHFWELEISEDGVFEGELDGTDPYFGIGGEFAATDNIAIRAEYTRFNGDAIDADFISGSIVWSF